MTDSTAAASPSSFNEVEATVGLLFALTEWSRRVFEEAAAAADLTAAQVKALMSLQDPTPMHTLATEMACDASNITGIADRLEARGLVTREACKGDRRVRLLALTEEGSRVREYLETAIYQASPLITELTAEEHGTLRTLLGKATQQVETSNCG